MTTVTDVISTNEASTTIDRSLRRAAKRWVNRVAPGFAFRVRSGRRRKAFCTAHGGAEFRATAALVAAHGRRVLGGPFQNLLYGDSVSCSAYVAKLVGCYEEELHEIVERIIARGYASVIDVGCAEGYYAVGFAKRMSRARVHAFDADPDAQRMCRALAKLNGVEKQVNIEGWCDHAALQRLAGPNTIVVCDCEGFELELLDSAAAPILRATDILVELHDVFHPGLTDRLLERFAATHEITLIDTRDRDPDNYDILSVVAPNDRPWAVREGRHGPMQWAYLVAKSPEFQE